jgi:hypothetical protein
MDASGNKTARPGGYTNQSLRDVNNVQEFIHDPSAVETYTVGGDTEHMHQTAHSSVAGFGRSYNNLKFNQIIADVKIHKKKGQQQHKLVTNLNRGSNVVGIGS